MYHVFISKSGHGVIIESGDSAGLARVIMLDMNPAGRFDDPFEALDHLLGIGGKIAVGPYKADGRKGDMVIYKRRAVDPVERVDMLATIHIVNSN